MKRLCWFLLACGLIWMFSGFYLLDVFQPEWRPYVFGGLIDWGAGAITGAALVVLVKRG